VENSHFVPRDSESVFGLMNSAGRLLLSMLFSFTAIATVCSTAAIEPRLEPLSVAYVLFLAIVEPLLARLAK
jgi:hypothetical protein